MTPLFLFLQLFNTVVSETVTWVIIQSHKEEVQSITRAHLEDGADQATRSQGGQTCQTSVQQPNSGIARSLARSLRPILAQRGFQEALQV